MQKFIFVLLSVLLIVNFTNQEVSNSFNVKNAQNITKGLLHSLGIADTEVAGCMNNCENAIKYFEEAYNELKEIHIPTLKLRTNHHHHHHFHFGRHIAKEFHHFTHEVQEKIKSLKDRIEGHLDNIIEKDFPHSDIAHIDNAIKYLNEGVANLKETLKNCKSIGSEVYEKIEQQIKDFDKHKLIHLAEDMIKHRKVFVAQIKEIKEDFEQKQWYEFGFMLGEIMEEVLTDHMKTNELETNFDWKKLEEIFQGIFYSLVGEDPDVQQCIHTAETALYDFEDAVKEFKKIHFPKIRLNELEENHHHHHHWLHHISHIIHHDVHHIEKKIHQAIDNIEYDLKHIDFIKIIEEDIRYIKDGLKDIEKGALMIPKVLTTCEHAFKNEKEKIMKLIRSFSNFYSFLIHVGVDVIKHRKTLLVQIKQAREHHEEKEWFMFGANIGEILKEVFIGNEREFEQQNQ